MLTRLRRLILTWTDTHTNTFCYTDVFICGCFAFRMIKHHNHNLVYDFKTKQFVVVM